MNKRTFSTRNPLNYGENFSRGCELRGVRPVRTDSTRALGAACGMTNPIRASSAPVVETSPLADDRQSIPANNADIRPFITIGEAADLALSKIAAKMKEPE